MESGIYIHGTDPEEQRRLSLLNDVLNPRLLRELPSGDFGRVLDVGCGLGQLTRAVARGLAPGARVVGVERDPAQIAEARRQAAEAGEAHLVEIREGDAVALPLEEGEWGTFDLVLARFLLEHVPDPAAVVSAMARAARPGGTVVLADDDHDTFRLWPEAPSVLALWRAYIRTYDRNGNDPFVGRRLVSLLAAAGARPARATLVSFGACAGEPAFRELMENLAGVFVGVRGALVEGGLVEADFFERALGELRDWAARPDAALWYSVCYAEGVVGLGERPE